MKDSLTLPSLALIAGISWCTTLPYSVSSEVDSVQREVWNTLATQQETVLYIPEQQLEDLFPGDLNHQDLLETLTLECNPLSQIYWLNWTSIIDGPSDTIDLPNQGPQTSIDVSKLQEPEMIDIPQPNNWQDYTYPYKCFIKETSDQYDY